MLKTYKELAAVGYMIIQSPTASDRKARLFQRGNNGLRFIAASSNLKTLVALANEDHAQQA